MVVNWRAGPAKKKELLKRALFQPQRDILGGYDEGLQARLRVEVSVK